MYLPNLARYLTLALAVAAVPAAHSETIGGGTIASPAEAPQPSFGIGGSGFVPVKNWNFGTDANSTIRTQAEMNANFYYHDQHGTFTNKYGSQIVAPDATYPNKLNQWQKVELTDTAGKKVREFFTGSLRTYLVPLEDANGNAVAEVSCQARNVGNGSFMARWTLPNAGGFLNQDIIWETRVRYVTPKYFWFAIWASGKPWNNGGESDLVESYGEDRPPPSTYQNYDGRFWHSGAVGGTNAVNYHASWQNGMILRGITSYDATQYHTWTWHYRANNTYSIYVDGIEVQNGTQIWTNTGAPLDPGNPNIVAVPVWFLFDGAWGHTTVEALKDKTLASSELAGKYYEWDYSRVYLGPPSPTTANPHPNVWYRLSAQANPSKALHDSAGLYTDTNGTYTLSNTWSSSDVQRWKFSDAGSGYYRIYSKSKWAKALHDAAQVYSGDAAGNYQITYPYSATADWQKWKVVDLGSGYYRLYSKHRSNRALHESLQVYTPAPTANYVISYPWNSTYPSQKWKLTAQ